MVVLEDSYVKQIVRSRKHVRVDIFPRKFCSGGRVLHFVGFSFQKKSRIGRIGRIDRINIGSVGSI